METPLGKVLGKDYGNFQAFKGVPYSEKPRRFEAPEAKLPWTGTWNGAKFGNSCIHGFSHHDEDPLESFVESEDCLFANVWVPKIEQSKLLPVVVFIHGGGFVRNSGATPNFWGDAFVTDSEAPAILVTFNYRLGIFGFFSWNGTTTNVGFQDQQLLLRWVQQNIKAFGGNPNKVLLMGQSAGAMSILCHVAAPGSAGLFHSAMSNSPVGLYYRNRAENDEFVRSVAHALLCTGNVTSCLQNRPAKALRDVDVVPEYLKHFTTCPECANALAWLPIIDPETLPLNPLVAIERNVHNKVPTIISAVTNETLAFVPTLLFEAGNNRLAYDEVLRVFFDDRAKLVQDHYTNNSLSWAERLGVATTDALMTCYGRYVARALARSGPSYLSTFMVQPHSSQMQHNKICVQGPPAGASCHAADISYQIPVSQRMASRTHLYYANEKESTLAASYARSIINFANGQSLPFVPYSQADDLSTSWNLDGPGKLQHYHHFDCDFWEGIGYADVWKSLKFRESKQSQVTGDMTVLV